MTSQVKCSLTCCWTRLEIIYRLQLRFARGFLQNEGFVQDLSLRREYMYKAKISNCCLLPRDFKHLDSKIVSEYDQEIPQSQTADKPMAS